MSRGFGATFGAGTTDSILMRYSAALPAKTSFCIYSFQNGNGGGNLGRLYSGNDTYRLDQNGGAAQWALVAPFTTTSPVFSFPQPTLGVWHSIVATYDGSSTANTPIIYVDGKLVTTSASTAAGTYNATAGNNYIGNAVATTRNWDGMLSQFGLWPGIILTPSEALALASGISPLLIRPDSLASYIPMDGVNNPEPDTILGSTVSIIGTRLGVSEAPIRTVYFDSLIESALTSPLLNLLGRIGTQAKAAAKLSPALALAARTAAQTKANANFSGTTALTARATSTSTAHASGTFKTLLSSLAKTTAMGRVFPVYTLPLTARATSTSTGRGILQFGIGLFGRIGTSAFGQAILTAFFPGIIARVSLQAVPLYNVGLSIESTTVTLSEQPL